MPKSRRKPSVYRLIASRLVDAADEVTLYAKQERLCLREDAYSKLLTLIELVEDMEIPPSDRLSLRRSLRKAERIYDSSGLLKWRMIDFDDALNNAER